MTWQDLKNVARYTYEQSRDAAYEKLQDRGEKARIRPLKLAFYAACLVLGFAFGSLMGMLARGLI